MGLQGGSDAFPLLETDRLLLRQMTDEDAEAFLAFFTDPVMAIESNLTPDTPAQVRGILAAYRQAWVGRSRLVWGIDLKEEGRLIGEISLTNMVQGRMADLGYYLLPAHWNSGYMTEAVRRVVRYGFESLELSRIQATVAVGNAASARVLQKAGFTREGLLREYPMGPVSGDVYMFSIVRREYGIPGQ